MLSLISQHTSTLLKVYLESFFLQHITSGYHEKNGMHTKRQRKKKDSHQNETWQKY